MGSWFLGARAFPSVLTAQLCDTEQVGLVLLHRCPFCPWTCPLQALVLVEWGVEVLGCTPHSPQCSVGGPSAASRTDDSRQAELTPTTWLGQRNPQPPRPVMDLQIFPWAKELAWGPGLPPSSCGLEQVTWRLCALVSLGKGEGIGN